MPDPIPYDSIADVYDTYVQTQLDVPFFRDMVQQVHGEILELMSGTGRVSLPLIEAGAHLTCMDYSAEMLGVLQNKLTARGLRADLHVADVRTLDLGKTFELVFIPFHAFVEITEPADEQQALARIHEHLAADGQFICALHNPQVRRRTIDGQLHLMGNYSLEGDRKLVVWFVQNYVEGDRVVSVQEFFEEYDARGVMQQRRYIELRFALIEYQEFCTMTESAGFTLRAVYGNYDKSPFQSDASPFIIAVMGKA